MKKITPSQKRRLERRKQLRAQNRSKLVHMRLFRQLGVLVWLQNMDIRNEFWFLFVEGGI